MNPPSKDKFGPWMLVTRKDRRPPPPKKTDTRSKIRQPMGSISKELGPTAVYENQLFKSRFSPLGGLEEDLLEENQEAQIIEETAITYKAKEDGCNSTIILNQTPHDNTQDPRVEVNLRLKSVSLEHRTYDPGDPSSPATFKSPNLKAAPDEGNDFFDYSTPPNDAMDEDSRVAGQLMGVASSMAKHHPDLIMCRKQPGIAIGRLCEKCDGKCVICDSYVRPCTLVRVCDECNYGSFQGRCVICGGLGISDAYYCKECTQQEKDRDGCPKIVNLGSAKTDLFYEHPKEITMCFPNSDVTRAFVSIAYSKLYVTVKIRKRRRRTARMPGLNSDTGRHVWPAKSSFSDMSYSCTSIRSKASSGTVNGNCLLHPSFGLACMYSNQAFICICFLIKVVIILIIFAFLVVLAWITFTLLKAVSVEGSAPQVSSSESFLLSELLCFSLIVLASRYSFGGFVEITMRCLSSSGEGNSFKHSDSGTKSISPNVFVIIYRPQIDIRKGDIMYILTLSSFIKGGRKRKPTMWEEHQNTEEDKKRKAACERLTSVTPQVKPSEVKGDRSKSLLFDACITTKINLIQSVVI
nr:PHD finger-like domain-containing protein 5B [Ipomoea batatas]